LAVGCGIWWWLSREPPLPPGRAALWDDATDPLPPNPSIGSGKSFVEYANERITRRSEYVTMRDGVRLAVDSYVPKSLAPGKRLPTLLCQTRYYRQFELRWPFSRFRQPPASEYPQFWVLFEYGFVLADVRGTGASFGSRAAELSPDEVADGAELVNWIVTQPWSDGQVGAYGVSYSGTAAELLLTTMPPAVKAAAFLSSPYDVYLEGSMPGGILWRAFNRQWSDANDVLDRNQLGGLASWRTLFAVKGVRPVDSDTDGKMLHAAVAEHAKNHHLFEELQRVTFRDDRIGAYSFDELSPSSFREKAVATRVPIYNLGGWFEMSAASAAVDRFHSVPNPGSRLTLGPWTHQRVEISPGRERRAQRFYEKWDVLRFFDYHLKGIRRPLDPNPVHYWTLVEEKWKSSATWPPAGVRDVEYYFAANHALSNREPVEAGDDSYRVRTDVGRGIYTRWDPSSVDGGLGYIRTDPGDAQLLVYDSSPLGDATEVTGDPELTLWLTSSAGDGQFFVYLEDVDADGRINYVTEGLLRALDLAVSQGPFPYAAPGAWHSFRRADARPLIPGEAAEVKINLMPVSYLFRPGHRIRMALAGADKDHFDPLPGPPPEWRILRDRAHPSRVRLPMMRP
jgi:putative CocE/NonD family hydrolase